MRIHGQGPCWTGGSRPGLIKCCREETGATRCLQVSAGLLQYWVSSIAGQTMPVTDSCVDCSNEARWYLVSDALLTVLLYHLFRHQPLALVMSNYVTHVLPSGLVNLCIPANLFCCFPPQGCLLITLNLKSTSWSNSSACCSLLLRYILHIHWASSISC